MTIIWSPRAKRRLREYAQNLAQYDYPQTAIDWLNAVRENSERLSDLPQSGRKSPEFATKRPIIRDITIAKNYRLFYRIRRGCIEILSIHNCRQRLTSLQSL